MAQHISGSKYNGGWGPLNYTIFVNVKINAKESTPHMRTQVKVTEENAPHMRTQVKITEEDINGFAFP